MANIDRQKDAAKRRASAVGRSTRKEMNLYQRYSRLTFWNKLGALGAIASICGIVFLFLPHSPETITTVTASVDNSPSTVQQTVVNSPNSVNLAAQSMVFERPALTLDQLKQEIQLRLQKINPEILDRINAGETHIPVMINAVNLQPLLSLADHNSFNNFLELEGTGARFQGVVEGGGHAQIGNHLNDLNQRGILDGYVLVIKPSLR